MKRRLAIFCAASFLAMTPAFAVSPPAPAKPKLKPTPAAQKPEPQKKMTELPLLEERAPAPAANPSAVKDHLAKAEESAARGNWAMAEETLRAALKIDPQNADVVLNLSRALMEQGKEEAATAVLVGYGGTDLRVTQALGEAYVSTAQLTEAEQVFMDLSLRQPAEPYHRYNLGLVEVRMGKYDMAENAYQRAIELDPKFSDARYNLALLYIRNREYPKALAQLEEAVRVREDPDYLINYGVVLRELNRFPSSQAALERALELDPNNTLALNNLGITHYLAGNMEDSRKAFTRTLDVSPEDPTARSYLAKISVEPRKEPAPKSDRASIVPPAPIPTPKKPSGTAEKIPASPSKQDDMAPAKKTADLPPVQDLLSDVDRIRRENEALKEKLEFLESRMAEIKRGVVSQIAEEEKVQAQRVDAALKAAQARLEKKEKELEKKAAAEKDPQSSEGVSESYAAVRASLDDRLNELQKTLAMARTELEAVRRQQAPVMFSPEPGTAEERLNAADLAVQQMQRQIRQLTIERDMLRTEIEAMRPSGSSGSPRPTKSSKTNVNLADLSELLMVPGMEERLAHNLLWYRQNIGPFRSLIDLKKVPGMAEAHYSQMVDFVSIGPERVQ